ncbi:MAG: glycosyltransferase family 39 protein [Gallionella sp.]|jgi:4-amino-4-deoxy-L-arabinose transferase-like glycosyltransferase
MNRTLILLLLAALSFLPTLGFYMVGEEGSYTISSLEMWHSRDWLSQTIYGQHLQRPPLINWLTVPIATLTGWSHVLLAVRMITVAATLGMAAWLYWLTRKLFGDKAFALFAALSCLSLADLLLYRGWLSYTDPLFGFFIFAAIASLWAGCEEKHKGWLGLSVVWIGCALLTKVFTAYIFYATALLVLFWQPGYRRFLLSPAPLLILSSALIVPFIWFTSLPQVSGQSGSMAGEIAGKLSESNGMAYLQRLFTYPLETLLWLLPAPLLALYLLLRKRIWQPESHRHHFHTALFITGLSILPYWLAPQGGIRYLVPIYPLIALISARLIWRSGDAGQQLALRWFTGLIALKFVFALAVFPYYQSHYRGENYVSTARDISNKTRGYPLYVSDVRSISMNIIGQIDIDRLPLPPIYYPPVRWNNGFLLSMEPVDEGSQLVEKIVVAKDAVYLFCRGTACLAGTQR